MRSVNKTKIFLGLQIFLEELKKKLKQHLCKMNAFYKAIFEGTKEKKCIKKINVTIIITQI